MGPMRRPLTEGWISTVPNFTGAGGTRDTFNNCLSSAKMTTSGTTKGEEVKGGGVGGVGGGMGLLNRHDEPFSI